MTQENLLIVERVLEERALAQQKALRALAGYKFWMFGYWAAAWVRLNRLLPPQLRAPNPFKRLVVLARAMSDVPGGAK